MQAISLALLCALLVSGVSRADAQWRTINSPGANAVDVLRNLGGNLYAGTRGNGVFVFRNNTWVSLNNGLTNYEITDLAWNGSSLFAGTKGGGVFRSDNNGERWFSFNNGITNPNVVALAIGNGNIVLAACSRLINGQVQSAVFRSANGGQSWEKTSIDSQLNLYSLSVVGNEYWLGSFGGLTKTRDGGLTWENVGKPEDFFAVYVSKVLRVANTWYAATVFGGLSFSLDNGATWQKFNEGLPANQEAFQVNAILYVNQVLYAGTSHGVYYRSITSSWWLPYSAGLPSLVVSSLELNQGKVHAGLLDGQVCTNDGKPLTLATVSAATYNPGVVAQNSIASLFGETLAPVTFSASTVPLPTSLAGVSVQITDSVKTTRTAGLFFVSPGQINFAVPSGIPPGLATITVNSSTSQNQIGAIYIAESAFGIFTANSSGEGVPAALHLQIVNGVQTYKPISRFDAQLQRWVPIKLELGGVPTGNFLVVYGTGFRPVRGVSISFTNIGASFGIGAEVAPVSGLVGLDQINVPLSLFLQGKGEFDLTLFTSAQRSNVVKVLF
jgi:uncharacterized protein (TIGR03437 family)